MGDTVLDLSLDNALERACSILWVVAHLSQQVPRGVGKLQRDVPLGQAWAQTIVLDFHNVLHLLTRDLMEDDDLIDAVVSDSSRRAGSPTCLRRFQST